VPSKQTLDAFLTLVIGGKHDEAIEKFYTPNSTMQENLGPPRKGRDGNVKREQMVMGAFKEIHSDYREPIFVNGDHVVINWIFKFVAADGSGFTMDEIAWQRWDGEKIAEERFYYDPAQRGV
jgi:ketosteroid isomerase-like protein